MGSDYDITRNIARLLTHTVVNITEDTEIDSPAGSENTSIISRESEGSESESDSCLGIMDFLVNKRDVKIDHENKVK